MVKYAILGPIELSDGERLLHIGGPRQVALLAFLLVHANRAVSSDRLIDALWGQRSPAGALQNLHVAISRLRKRLDGEGAGGQPALRAAAGGYLLAVSPGELDAEVFQARMQAGRHALAAGEAVRARDVLGEALAMWRGPALAQVAYKEFAQPEIRRLEELRLGALEARVECDLRLGEHGGVIAELEALVAIHPGRERLAAQLMVALYRCGRQGDALEVFTHTRAYLTQELGIEPGPALQALQADVLAQSPALQPLSGAPGSAVAMPVAEQADVLPTGVVTFLMTDVEGSTRLWDADADAMAVALEFHEGGIARAVQHHGGHLLQHKGEGDSTLSVFQRATAAAACAAELQRELATMSWPSRLKLRVRIALHSGEAQERDGDYFGPVLNRAARLRSLAAGGQTVLSQTTAELVRDRLPRELALVDLGRHELRGLSWPERVFELRAPAGSSPVESSIVAEPIMLELPRSLQPPARFAFVGRDAELARLRECWEQLPGDGRVAVVIGGEPGIGKTRLASEFAGAVHEQGALVLYGRCDEGLALPYQPFVEALRPYARALGVDRLRAEFGDLAPELGRLLPEFAALGAPSGGDPESARFALFEAVAALIHAMTRQRHALLVLDDLHWAATPTLLLLRHLLRCECPLSGMVLCTYRETELDPGQPLAQLLADLHRDASAEHLSVGGLEETAIAALVKTAVGHAPDNRASQLARVLGAQTAGNPFFIRELLAHLAESNNVLGAGFTATRLQVPEGLRQVIRQRVARLSAPAGCTLRAAAVAGPVFSFVLLERMLGEELGVLDALDEAVAAGLLTEAAGHGDFAFAHALVRQTIYRQLGAARRMRLHRQIGEALETLGDTEEHVETLAYHFAQAAADGQAVKAATYALAAGCRATARLGYEEAAAHYERGLQALTLSGQPQEQQRCELLLALGEARWGAGELDKARQAYGETAELAQKLGDVTALAHAALGFCGPHRGEVTAVLTRPVINLLQRALAAMDKNDSSLRAQLMGRLGAVLSYTGVEQDKPILVREALEMARRVADKAVLADVLASSLWATRGPDTLHESMAMARELERVADEVVDRPLQAMAHIRLIEHLLELGEIDAVEREIESLRQLAEFRKERYFRYALAVVLAGHVFRQGRLEDFETLARDALAHQYEGHDEAAAQVFEGHMVMLHVARGQHGEFLQTVARLSAQYPQIASWRCARVYGYALMGRAVQARQELKSLAHADFSDIPRDGTWTLNLSVVSQVVNLLGDAPRAQVLYKLLSPYAERCVVGAAALCLGSVSRPLGLLATTLAKYDDAERHFQQALRMNTRIRSPPWSANTEHDYAQMLLLRNLRGDRDKALKLLNHALTTAEQLGLKALADTARPLKRAAETAGLPPTAFKTP